MYCKNCGKEIDGKFCSSCGTNNEVSENTMKNESGAPEISSNNTWNNTSNNINKPNLPKKPVFKKWWFWVIIAILIIGIGANLSDSENKTTEDDNLSTSQGDDTLNNNDKKDEISIQDIPVIKGSQAYDLILNIEEKTGIEKPQTNFNEETLTWDGINTQYSYHIESNKKHEVTYAKFFVFQTGETAFLGFCASMPYDTAENQNAMDWVNQNIGKETSTTIGDAEFNLINGTQGPILTIKAIGYDDYIKSILDLQ